MNENENMIEELQVKLAFLEDTVEKLSKEFFDQQTQINKLLRVNQQMLEKLKSLESQGDSGQVGEVVEEKPPHY